MASTVDDGDGASSGLEPLLLPRDVAARLRVSEKTLGEWRSARTGPTFLRLGRTIRYRSADVAAYLEDCAADGGDQADAESRPLINVKKRLKRKKAAKSGFQGVGNGENRSRRKRKGKKRRP